MTTGERIKQARLAAGLTQKELAAKVGVKFSAIHKYETGMVVNLKRETIAALAEALNVRPSWLMCMDEEGKPLVNNDEELTEMLEELRDRSDLRMLFSLTKNATKEDIQKTIQIIQMFRDGS